MNHLFKLVSGYIRIRLTGRSPERFFNLCGSSGLEIWDAAFDRGSYLFSMKTRDFFSCRPFVRKAGVRVRIQEKRGLPFFLHRSRARAAWGAGFAAFFLCLYALSFFVWDIGYEGNVRYTEDVLSHFLEEAGIVSGIRKSEVSCEALEEALRERFEGITWVSARLSGTRLYIHIKENEVPLSFPEQSHTPCDLRASSDGTITSVVVRSGLPLVKAGDTVTAGQILVTGCIPITDDSGSVAEMRYVHADADVKAVCARSEAEEIPVWHTVEPETGRRRQGLCVVLGNGKNGAHFVWMFPNIWKTSWKTVTSYRKARLFGDFYLPIHVGFIDSAEISPHEETYTKEQLLALADAYKNRLTENLMEKGVHIIENNVKILVNGPVCRFEAALLTEEAIAVEADLAMDE